MPVKRLLSCLAMLLLALTAFAENAPYGGTVVVAYYDEPTSLNPLISPNGSAALIESVFTNGLTRTDENGKAIPDLAERWEVSTDGLTWSFYLRKGVKFSDGSELTADDVVFTYKAYLDPKYQNPPLPFSQAVQSFTSEGKTVFKIILKAPSGRLPDFTGLAIVPARLLVGGGSAEQEFARHPIGTGPFTLTEWKKGQLTFDANPYYFQGRPHLDQIIFKSFQDPKKAWTSLMQGQTDLVTDIDNEDYLVIKNDTRFRTYEYLDAFCYPLLFNLKDPLFDQPRIRQAISAAIDRNDLVDKALQGGAVPTTGPFLPGTWAYNPDPSIQAYDPAKAAKILTDLGWRDTDGDWILDKDGKKLQFTTLIDTGDKLKEATAKRLQWQLLQVGIRMDVETVPLEDLIPNRLFAGKFQAAIMQINTLDPEHSTATFWHSSSIGRYNLTSYGNPEVDRLINLGALTFDPNARKNIYQKIHALISADAPAAFLFYKKRYTASSSRLLGFRTSPTSFLTSLVSDWYVINEMAKERR